MVQLLPEMQGSFDYNQIINMPHKDFSSEVGGSNNIAGLMNNSGPKIMDQGLLNQGFGMKKSLPLISDPNFASMAGISQFGNVMGNSFGNQNNLGSAIAGEFGNDNKTAQQEEMPNQNILEGGIGLNDYLQFNKSILMNYKNIVQLKQGTQNNFDLNDIQSGGMIEVPPEIQHYFDFEKLKEKNNKDNTKSNDNKKIFFLKKKTN